ncbi:NADH-quinone oxidoreductase subunit C [Akkermansiaceae bacterium]|nr:NADH-quinone oxidoreductase subunit C [Akkermansiaceae bacterium]
MSVLADAKALTSGEIIEFRGETTITVLLSELKATLEKTKEQGYELLIDVSSVDHLGEEPRFEMVYELATLDDSKHLRIKSKVAEDEDVPTVSDIWKTANWHEREVYDMMGIKFSGHPQMERILMWEGFPYFPLRKDFPLAGKESTMPEVAFSGVAPLEGGPFVTSPGSTRESGEPRAKGES